MVAEKTGLLFHPWFFQGILLVFYGILPPPVEGRVGHVNKLGSRGCRARPDFAYVRRTRTRQRDPGADKILVQLLRGVALLPLPVG